MQRTQELVCEAVIIVFFYFCTVSSHLPSRSLDTPSGPEQQITAAVLLDAAACWAGCFQEQKFWLLAYYSDVSHIMIDNSLSRHRTFLDYETS